LRYVAMIPKLKKKTIVCRERPRGRLETIPGSQDISVTRSTR